jgi:hypothetical protein
MSAFRRYAPRLPVNRVGQMLARGDEKRLAGMGSSLGYGACGLHGRDSCVHSAAESN